MPSPSRGSDVQPREQRPIRPPGAPPRPTAPTTARLAPAPSRVVAPPPAALASIPEAPALPPASSGTHQPIAGFSEPPARPLPKPPPGDLTGQSPARQSPKSPSAPKHFAPAGVAPKGHVAPTGVAPPLVSVDLTRRIIGDGPDAIPLQTPGWTPSMGDKPRLERLLDPLPELDVDISVRRLRRQPAFVVSVALAVAAGLAVSGWWVKHQYFSPPEAVQNIELLDAGDNYRLEWRGPDVPYTALLVHDDGEVQGNLQKWIRGWGLYMPKTYPGLTADSCFVVQPEGTAVIEKHLDLSNLDASGGALVCIADFLKENG